jgi:hypothetical protein
MDHKEKYIKYKTKYLELKINSNNQIGGGSKNKCYIDDTDKVIFGNGGSSAIIVITKDKRVYKIFTLYNFIPDLELDNEIKK